MANRLSNPKNTSPSRKGFINCFTDAAWLASSNQAGIGWTIELDNGPSVIHSSPIDNVKSVLAAEALAMRSALVKARFLRIPKIIVKSDSQKLINAINIRSSIVEIHGIFEDCRICSDFFAEIEFVFIPRGENFIADGGGINVYVDQDDKLRGVDPNNSLVKKIEESKIALAIFSSKYTESSWCLDELVKIKERVEEGKLVVFPIFYKMNPSEVKGLEGAFGINLWNQVKHTSEFDKLKKWKEALDFVSHKAGLVWTEDSDENEFITSIEEEVKRMTCISEELELSKPDKDEFMDTRFSKSEELKRVDNETGVTLLDANPEEAERIQGHEAKMYSNLRIDDGPHRRNDDISHGEANFDATLNLQNGVESKHGKVKPSSTIARYEKDTSTHQVFMNFRGEDVGFSFVSHLVSALKREGINIFIDKDERKSKDIGQIFKKIEDSKIAVVVFSGTYSESTWCLEELMKIKECMDQGKLKVIPISYKVEPLQLKELNGGFGNKLWNLWKLHRDHHIIRWKEALESVSSLDAMTRFWLKEDNSEGAFVASIVEEVKKVLAEVSLQQGQNLGTTGFSVRREEYPETFPNKDQLFGIEQRMEQLEHKLEFDCDETRVIGVVGMPGIGKTTLTMMLLEKWNCKFVRCVPLLEVCKKSKDYGLVWLRTTLLKVLLGGEIPVINDETTHESVKNALLQTKVFIVLDDVSDKKQLEFLLGDLKWVKKGSKIVITTCDKSLMKGLADDTYLVPQMNNEEAFQLFSSLALDDQIGCPPKTLADNAGGNPLALKLMAIEYRGKDKPQWENVFIQNVFKHYFDQLNEQQKDVFLDIASFFKSEDEYFVRSIMDSGDPDTTDAVSEVTDLVNKFLITISNSRIEMNDLVYTFGKQLGSPGRHKLWKYKDIINKLGKQGKIGFVLEVLIGTCFPGWKVPAWFSYRASGSMLKQNLPSHWCDNRDLDDAFLTETSNDQEEMNDLVYTFEKDLGSPEQYMRLNYKNITNKLKKMEKAEANNVRGIILDMFEVTKSIALERVIFTSMSNLRYLKIYDSCCPRHCKPDCELYFPDGLAFPLEDVRYLHWLKFPLRELPSDFRPENLVALRLPYSKIERVWEGLKETPSLRWNFNQGTSSDNQEPPKTCLVEHEKL
ncbi:hypothetical protein AALP_AAs46094U000200 [Arabis alpina]|uniref:ADP-ribosyl cyclase/cyclic ADP-ribose hydrolase n=1 Tax=Arabis alpina TaxID=50452 RepID=A0A087G2F8_ARAAL|nr:hypothetical protein AALP_AAs46094U000200 [Arabis alpina]